MVGAMVAVMEPEPEYRFICSGEIMTPSPPPLLLLLPAMAPSKASCRSRSSRLGDAWRGGGGGDKGDGIGLAWVWVGGEGAEG
jgi:hypothetical protein